MSSVPSSAALPGFRDQSVGLMVFGIFQILIGCFCGLMMPMVMISAMVPKPGMAPGAEAGFRTLIPGALFYLLLAVVFISLGIGSIRGRRWAWTLTVVLSWMWLIMGVASTAAIVFVMPKVFASMEQTARLPPGALWIVLIISGGIGTCMYILLPAVFLLFYHRASVRATCQWRDPKIRWTDRCPMPVLAVSLLQAFGAVSMVPLVACHCVAPFFGVLLSGLPGAAVIVVWILLMAWLAWGTYRLKMVAWWGTLLLYIVGTVSAGVTFSRVNPLEMYEKMGFSAAQLEMMRKTGIAETMFGHMWWFILPFAVVVVGYVLYLRRYFVDAAG